MAKKDPFPIRLDPEIRAALDKAAAKERRSRSDTARLILEEGLRVRGFLKEPSQEFPAAPSRR